MELKFDNFRQLVLNKGTFDQNIYRIFRVKQGDYQRDVLFTSRDLAYGGGMKRKLIDLGFDVEETRKDLILKIKDLELEADVQL